MNKINLREELVKLDIASDFKYSLTELYEACSLTEEDKKELKKRIDKTVQYNNAYNFTKTNQFLSNKAGIPTDICSDDLTDSAMGGNVTGTATCEGFEDSSHTPGTNSGKKQLNEGPGAGYTIKSSGYNLSGKLGTYKITDMGDYIKFECPVVLTGTVSSFEASGYYAGTGEQHDLPIDCSYVEMEVSKDLVDKLELMDEYTSSVNEDNLLETIVEELRGASCEFVYGGGYSHATYDGQLTHDSYLDADYIDIQADIFLSNDGDIEKADRMTRGYGYETVYGVVADNWVEDAFESEEEAIEYAKEYGYDAVRIMYVTTKWNGDEDTDFGDIIWTADEDVEESLTEGSVNIDQRDRKALRHIRDYREYKYDIEQLHRNLEKVYGNKRTAVTRFADLDELSDSDIDRILGGSPSEEEEDLTESHSPTDSEFEFINSKSVLDSDGFYTDYTWYRSADGLNVFVFGDNEVYTPEAGYFDYETESDEDAQEWFDSYNGFGDDDLDESADAHLKIDGNNMVEIPIEDNSEVGELGHPIQQGIGDPRRKRELNESKTFSQWFDEVSSPDHGKEYYPFSNYIKTFPNAEVLADATAEDIRNNAHKFYDVYDVDSSDREKAFNFASEELGMDYDDFYYAWLYEKPISSSLNERGLTRSERHNRNMEKTFDYKKQTDNKMMQFLRDNSDMSEEEIKKAYDDDKLGLVIKELGLHDAFWSKNESVNPSSLTDCPACGDTSFDSKKGKCTKCSYRESLKEDWAHFEFKSCSNPYIAKNEKEKNRILRKYGNKAKEVKPGFYEIDDTHDIRDTFKFDSLTESTGDRFKVEGAYWDEESSEAQDSDGLIEFKKSFNDVDEMIEFVLFAMHNAGVLTLTNLNTGDEIKLESDSSHDDNYYIKRIKKIASNTKSKSINEDIMARKTSGYDKCYKEVKKAIEKNDTGALSDIRDYFGFDLYKMCLGDVRKELGESFKMPVKEAFKPEDSGVQSVKVYNQYNYTIQELRIDNDAKTFERGNFTMGRPDKKFKNRQQYEDVVDQLKELGYTEVGSDYQSLRNKSRKGESTNESWLTAKNYSVAIGMATLADKLQDAVEISIGNSTVIPVGDIKVDYKRSESSRSYLTSCEYIITVRDTGDDFILYRITAKTSAGEESYKIESSDEDGRLTVLGTPQSFIELIRTLHNLANSYNDDCYILSNIDFWSVRDLYAGDWKSWINESLEEAFKHPQSDGPWWYLCKHGIGPGALPKGVYVIDVIDDEENPYRCYVALDKVLTTDELKQFEMKEARPPQKMTESTSSSKLILNAITELVKSGSSISDPDFVTDVMDYMEDAFGEYPKHREVLNAIRDFRSKDRTNTLKPIDTSNRNTFQVGDEMTYSGLYGGETTIKVIGVNGSRMEAEISWTSMDDGSTLKDKEVYDIVLDDEGNDCIEVWHYRGETGRVYPPERDGNLKEDYNTPDENRFLKLELVPDNRKWQYSVGGKDVPYTSYEDAIAHIEDDYNICDYREELQQYLKDNGFDYFVDETFDGRLCIEINRGDWKHEHRRADYLVRHFFMDKGLGVSVDEQVTEEDGSDCYSADHCYSITDLYFSGRVVD